MRLVLLGTTALALLLANAQPQARANTPELAVSAQAQSAFAPGFTAEALRDALLTEMPGTLRLAALNIEAAANAGTAVDPRIRTRFSARLVLAADTFVVERREGPVTFVRRLLPAGGERQLFATSTSTLRAGQWAHEIEVQNPQALQGLGEPLAFLPGRVVVIGSDEERALIAERETEVQRAHQARLAEIARQREVEAAQRANADAAAQAQQQQRLTQQQRDAELAAAGRRAAEAEAVAAAERSARAEAARQRVAREAEVAATEELRRLAAERQTTTQALTQATEAERAARAALAAVAEETRRAQRIQQDEEAVATAERAARAEVARQRVLREAETAAIEEVRRLAAARTEATAVLTAATQREREAREAALRAGAEAREAAVRDLRTRLASEDRTVRFAAADSALSGNDPGLRALAFEMAWTGRDPALANLALRHFVNGKRRIPLEAFAPQSWSREDQDPRALTSLLGSATIEIAEYDLASGAGRGHLVLGAIRWEAAVAVARGELTVSARGAAAGGPNVNFVSCTINARLSERAALEGLGRCAYQQANWTSAPAIVRIALD